MAPRIKMNKGEFMNKPEVTRKSSASSTLPSGVLGASTSKTDIRKMTREELGKQIQKMRDRDAEMVSGIFKNLENPGSGSSRGTLVFSYCAYPNDENVIYELVDGERYTLPRGVARHLNNNCFYKEYQQMPAGHGMDGIRGAAHDGRLATANYQMGKKIHRYAFHSLEFMDDDSDMRPTNLTEVTIAP